MRALTLWPEWAWSVCHLGNDVENRGYPIPDKLVGHRIGIHAGVTVGGGNKQAAERSLLHLEDVARGAGWTADRINEGPPWRLETVAIVFKMNGEEFVLDVKRWWGIRHKLYRGCIVATAVLRGFVFHDIGYNQRGNSNHIIDSPWSEEGSYSWKLDDMILLSSPVACRGQQRLWTVPQDVEVILRRQYE